MDAISEPDTKVLSDLVTQRHQLLVLVETDMSLFFRALIAVDIAQYDSSQTEEALAEMLDCYYQLKDLGSNYKSQFNVFLLAYQKCCQLYSVDHESRVCRMNAVNPLYVLRNYQAVLTIEKAEQGDFSLAKRMLSVLKQPYTEQENCAWFAEKRPEWAWHKVGCSMLSCSS